MEIGPHGGRIVDRVDAVAAHQHVRAGAAGQCVVAYAALQHVDAGARRKRIVKARTGEVLDALEHVALGVAAKARAVAAAIDGDVHALGGIAVMRGIGTEAADQPVGAALAAQLVVTSAAVEHIGAAGADQLVAEGRADNVLHGHRDIARGVATGRNEPARGAVRQDHLHERGRSRVVDRVDALAADQHIRAAQPDEPVVAAFAVEAIDLRIALQHVVAARAGEVLDAREHIALGVAAAQRGAAILGKRDVDRRRGRVLGRVDAKAAGDDVGARATHQGVVELAADQRVGKGRADDALDQLQLVALGVAAQARTHRQRICYCWC